MDAGGISLRECSWRGQSDVHVLTARPTAEEAPEGRIVEQCPKWTKRFAGLQRSGQKGRRIGSARVANIGVESERAWPRLAEMVEEFHDIAIGDGEGRSVYVRQFRRLCVGCVQAPQVRPVLSEPEAAVRITPR